MGMSMAQRVAEMSDEERAEIFAGFTEEDYESLQWDWSFWGRPEQFVPEGTFIHLALAGRGWGKSLNTGTEIRYASGEWKTLREVRDGDIILDEKGNPTKVLKAHTPYLPEKVYRVHFSDGTYLDADDEHQWVTWTTSDIHKYNYRHGDKTGYPENWATYIHPVRGDVWSIQDLEFARSKKEEGWTDKKIAASLGRSAQAVKRKRQRGFVYESAGRIAVKTTADIRATLVDSLGQTNHRIPTTQEINYTSEVELPIDPWVLGYHLGDGHTETGGSVACAPEDKVFLRAKYESLGFETSATRTDDHFYCKSMHSIWRGLGMHRGKHIPDDYFKASVNQRVELIKGMVDSDGHVGLDGRVYFHNTNKKLIDGFVDLCRSIGLLPRVYHKEAGYRYGRNHADSWTVSVAADRLLCSLPRKVVRQKVEWHRRFKTRHVVSVEEIEPVAVRCLTVDSPTSMYLAGRALVPTHNTRAMSEWVREQAMKYPGCRIALVGRASGDTSGTMIYGESGIMNVSPESERPHHKISQRKLIWPNGSTAETFSSQEPSQLRGPQFHKAASDELGSWLHTKDDSGLNAWANLKIATRLEYNKNGKHSDPQIFVATTPKRVDTITDILDRYVEKPGSVSIARGSTYDNMANLSEMQIEELTDMYEGTDIGKQELMGEMLLGNEGVLWTSDLLQKRRIETSTPPRLPYRVVAVDPSVAEDPTDECGIVVIGATNHPLLHKRTAVVLEDATIKAPPQVWAKIVADLAVKYNAPIVVERNQGGALVPMAVHGENPHVKVFTVWADGSKRVRAEPVVIRYQNGQVRHWGHHPDLESQMIGFDPENSKKSPDRVDALVWGVTALLIKPPKGMFPKPIRGRAPRGRLPGGRGTGITR